MPDILHKEGNDRTETIPGATSLIKQLANTRKIEIDTVKEDRPKYFDNNDNDANDWRTESSVLGEDDETSSVTNVSVSSDDICPEDSASCVDKRNQSKNDHQRKQKAKPKSADAIKREKAFALWKYKKCNPDNRYSPICLDMSNTLEEIEDELAKVKEENEIDNAVDILRSMMTSFVGGVEYVSRKQKFVDLRLSGWSETVAFDIDSAKYDGVFSELYDEYRNSLQMSPWLKLAWLLGGSAVQFHILNKVNPEYLPKPCEMSITEKTEIPNPSINIDEIMARMRAAQESAQMQELSGSSGESDTSSSVESSSTVSTVSVVRNNTPQLRTTTRDTTGTARVSRLRSAIEKKRAEMATQVQPKPATNVSAPVTNPPVIETKADDAPTQVATVVTASVESPTQPEGPATVAPVKPKRVYKRKVPPTSAATAKPKVARKLNKSEPTTFVSETTAHPVPLLTNNEETQPAAITPTEATED